MIEGRHAALHAIGQLADAEIDIADAAVQLARVRAPQADWRAASAHLSELARASAAIGRALHAARLEARIGALAGLLHAAHSYAGDVDTYDDLDNANLIRVIERRRGLPVSLGILWLHCLRAAGWQGRGLDVPAHFLLQIDGDLPPEPSPGARRARRPRLVVDAFGNGAVLGMAELAALVRELVGGDFEPGPGIARPMGNRAVLLRLQRNITGRLARAAGREADALESLEATIAIAPNEAGLWREAAALNRRLARDRQAIACLERYISLVPEGEASRGARARIDAWRAGRG